MMGGMRGMGTVGGMGHLRLAFSGCGRLVEGEIVENEVAKPKERTQHESVLKTCGISSRAARKNLAALFPMTRGRL
jgi:hypothetical protein